MTAPELQPPGLTFGAALAMRDLWETLQRRARIFVRRILGHECERVHVELIDGEGVDHSSGSHRSRPPNPIQKTFVSAEVFWEFAVA
jgi:hypothetical protein